MKSSHYDRQASYSIARVLILLKLVIPRNLKNLQKFSFFSKFEIECQLVLSVKMAHLTSENNIEVAAEAEVLGAEPTMWFVEELQQLAKRHSRPEYWGVAFVEELFECFELTLYRLKV